MEITYYQNHALFKNDGDNEFHLLTLDKESTTQINFDSLMYKLERK